MHPPEPAYPCCLPALGRFTGYAPHEGLGPLYPVGAGSTSWVSFSTEDSPRGLGRTLGKRVGIKPSRVRISYPPLSRAVSTPDRPVAVRSGVDRLPALVSFVVSFCVRDLAARALADGSTAHGTDFQQVTTSWGFHRDASGNTNHANTDWSSGWSSVIGDDDWYRPYSLGQGVTADELTGGGSPWLCPCTISSTARPVNDATGEFWHTFSDFHMMGLPPAR